MSCEVMKVLPPKTVGPSQGCLQMSVKTIRWFIDSPGEVFVVSVWWGDDSKCIFLPKEESQECASHGHNKSYVFNICSSKEQFLIYLQYHRRLKFMVLKQKENIGIGVLDNLPKIFHDCHYDDYVDIYNHDSEVIADIRLCFNLTFFASNSPRNWFRKVESFEDDLHPRKAVSCYTQAEKPKGEFSQKISDLEPRSPVHSHFDESEKMLNLLRAEKKMSSLLNITNLRLTDDCDDVKYVPSTPSTPSSILSSTYLDYITSKSLNQHVLDYLTGVDMSDENQKKAVEYIRDFSPPSSLINFTTARITEKVMEDEAPRKKIPLAQPFSHSKHQPEILSQCKRSSPVKCHPAARLSASSNPHVNLKTQVCSPSKNKISKGSSPSKLSDFPITINFYRIALDRIIFNADGLRKLHGSGNVKSNQENNCPHGNYIIQYQLSKVDPKFRLEKTGPVRHLSRKTLANGVIFGENDVYKVRDLRSDDVVTSFKISCQFLNQRLPMFLGDTESLVIRESTKQSLFIKSLNGLTIGKLDVQIDVANSIDTLPPPETFSEMCKEEIDELIPSASFENFRAKSNNSKFLMLKAQLRNSSNEKLKNVPSAQYGFFLDSHSSLSKDLSDTAIPEHVNSSNIISYSAEPASEFSSDLSISSSCNKGMDTPGSYPDMVNSQDNLKINNGHHQTWKHSHVSDGSNAILKESNDVVPLKYAVVTHEFYVNVRNLDNCEECIVNYVFPECIANENGKVISKWAEASISTNQSRPFFISLPHGVSLETFLNKSRKKSISFYFKHPSHKKTIAKAKLDFVDIWTFEETFTTSSKSFNAKTIKLPLVDRHNRSLSLSAEIHVEYCNRVGRFTNQQNATASGNNYSDKRFNFKSDDNFSINDCLQTNTTSKSTYSDEIGHCEKGGIDKNSVASHILNTTFCVDKNENECEVSQQKNPDHDKPEIKSTDNPLMLKGGGDCSNIHFSDGNNLSTILENAESKNISKESRCVPEIIPLTMNRDVFYPNKEFVMNDLQGLSRLEISGTDHARKYPPKETPGMNLDSNSKSVLDVSSQLDLTNSENNQTSSALFCREVASTLVSVPTINVAFDDKINECKVVFDDKINECKVEPNQENPHQSKYDVSSDCLNRNQKKNSESFVVPNTSPVLSNEIISNKSVLEATSAQPNQLVLEASQNSNTSSDSENRAGDKILENYDSYPKCDVFNVGPVLPDCENDAIPKSHSPLDLRASNSRGQNAFVVDRNADISLNTVVSDDSVEILDQDTSGYLSMRDSFQQKFRDLSRNQSSNEPNICKQQQRVVPQVDDFGITLKNMNQNKCFLARIGIVRCFNIPMIRLKGTKQLTRPSTYVTFNDCFKNLHCSGSYIESLIPEYDSRHKAWLSTELLIDTEERLVFQVWCKRYQKEWAGPDCDRDRCLGYVYCNLSVLMYNFPYAGGWHDIISASGKVNGYIQILVKPLQSIDFVKSLECEELVHDQTKLVNDLQPYNYYLHNMNNNQNSGISSKQLLSQNIAELENTIKELQISHENRQTKSQERSANKDALEDKLNKSEFADSDCENSRESLHEKINKLPWVSKEDLSKKSTPVSTSGKGARNMIANCFLSFRKKSRKHKKLHTFEDDSGSLSSGSIVESEDNKTSKRDSFKNDGTSMININEETQSPKIDSTNSGTKNSKKSPSVFPRRFSFKLKKSGNKNKVHQNALLQTLPLYENNTEKFDDDKKIHVRKTNKRYHSL